MTDHTRLYEEIETAITSALSDARETLTDAERDEVMAFLDVREYGLALQTLVAILMDGHTRIASASLQSIDQAAALMRLTEERFMHDLHACFDRLTGVPNRR